MRGRTAVGVLVVALLLGGCDGSDDSSAEESTTSSSTATTTTSDRQDAEEQAVIKAYLASIEAFYAAANPPDPDHPALAKTSAGPLLEGVRANLADLAARRIGIRRGDKTTDNPRVTRLTRSAAVIEDCGVDGDIQFNLDTGETVDDSVITGKSTVKLVKRDGKWIAFEITFTEQPCE